MPRSHAIRRVGHRRAAMALITGLVLILAGCHTPSDDPVPPQPSPKRPFTVMSTDPIRVVDPAAAVDQGSAILAQNVYQRLMTADPGTSAPKPDAARDCMFTTATVYTCTLNTELKFQNGHELTSSDVKFSIERLTRLDIPGSAASQFSSLRRIETPDPLTVHFVLSKPDSQIGWALASTGAAVVDEETYDADEIRSPDQPIVGSGPYQVSRFGPEELQLAIFTGYKGRTPGRLPGLVYRVAPDSGTIEEAIADAEVDVVWRGLNAAAVTRLRQQASAAPNNSADGFTARPLNGTRVHQLLWNPDSSPGQTAAVRKAIALALQSDRTLDSIVPPNISGYVSSFPVGGVAEPKITWSKRIQLTLSYDPTSPDDRDLANQIRSRLEDTGGLSVRLRPDDAAADLILADRKAWTATPMAWLQPYLSAPPESSRKAVQSLESQFREATDDAKAQAVLGQLQSRAASDLTVLPINQADEFLFIRVGVDVDPLSFGPGWQLGFWGMSGG